MQEKNPLLDHLELKAKVVRHGNTFAIPIPRALVRCNVLQQNVEYKMILTKKKEIPIQNAPNVLSEIFFSNYTPQTSFT